MKRILSVIAMVLILALAMGTLTACQLFNQGEQQQPADDKVTVSWYQGGKLLKEQKVEKGATIESWEPVVEGKTFQGWYAEASLTEPFDFTKPVNEDVDIFAAFKSDEYVEDTISYYLIGTGAGDMGKAAWDHTAAENNLTMTKENVAGANVYTITITMYAGDRFQICHDGSWTGQQGIGIFKGAEYAEGVNPNKVAEGVVTAADKKYAEVKNEDGEVVFIGGDENGNAFINWNAILNEGHDGVYKFTLTTYPNSTAYNQVTWELVEKLDAQVETHSMHMVGTFNNWNANDDNELYHLNKSDDGKTWSGFITVGADGAMMKVVNQVAGSWHPDGIGNDIVLTEGTWAIQYVVETNEVKYEKLEYYIVGTLLDAEGKAVNYAVKEGACPKLVAQEDGSYTVAFETYDVTGLIDYGWMKDQNKTDADGVPAIISIKVVFGSSLGIKDWYSAEGGDNWYLSAGTYTVTLKDGAVTVTK